MTEPRAGLTTFGGTGREDSGWTVNVTLPPVRFFFFDVNFFDAFGGFGDANFFGAIFTWNGSA